MTIRIQNTFTGKKEDFKPIKKGCVTMYVCGVTPYDEVHLGHARAYVTFDVIRRHLLNSGYKVNYIQNFTDIDDKIIKRATERKISPGQLAEENIKSYFTQMDKLNILRANQYPRVTENIAQIVKFIERLMQKGSAYQVGGDVYFSIRSFKDYGKLSKRNIEDLKSGARVEIGEQKKDPLDFALWKKSKPDEPAEVSFDSPWGKGRPGWHIECSVMSTNILGETIDIHGGGQDLIFPHHENEIAQTEAATGKTFVNYWIHNGFVTINKEKMSKSLGNFFTLKDIFGKYEPRVVRYYLLSQNYHGPLDFSDENLKQVLSALNGIDNVTKRIKERPKKCKSYEELSKKGKNPFTELFKDYLDDNFNTEGALAIIHEMKRSIHGYIINEKEIPEILLTAFYFFMEDCLGIPLLAQESIEIPKEIKNLLDQRYEARLQKNWKKSDELRKKIEEKGYQIEDNPDGTSKIFMIENKI